MPSAAIDPPPASWTDHATTVSALLATVPWNFCEALVWSEALEGEMATLTAAVAVTVSVDETEMLTPFTVTESV